jgi:preprotein translocase subunit YajC
MSTTTLFIFGSFIFATYMFFLLRMISKQHKKQKENPNQNPTGETILRIERSNENRQAS